MALNKQILRVPLSGGVDTKTAEKHIQPGSGMIAIENGVLDKIGKIRKRSGFAEQTITSGAYSIDGGYGLVGSDALYLHRRNINLSSDAQVGRLFHVTGSTSLQVGAVEPIHLSLVPASSGVAQSSQAANPDLARCSSRSNLCAAWRESRPGAASTSIWYSVIDETTNSMIVNSKMLTESNNPTQVRVVCVGTTYCILAVFDDLSGIVLFKFSATSPDGSATSHAVTSCDSAPSRLNAVTGSYNGTACAVIAYIETDGADRKVKLAWAKTNGTVLNTITVAAPPNPPKTTSPLGLDLIGTIAVVSWVEDVTGKLWFAAYDSTSGSVVLDPTVADATTSCDDASRLTAAMDSSGAGLIRLYAELMDPFAPYNYATRVYEIARTVGNTTPTSITRLRTMERVGIGAKAYAHGNMSRLWTWHDSGYEYVDGVYVQGLQNSYTLERIDRTAATNRERVVECKAMAGIAASYPTEVAPASSSVTLADGTHCAAVLARKYEVREGSSSNYYVDQIVLLRSKHDIANTPWVRRGDYSVMAGQPAILHHRQHTPIGFILSPEHVLAAAGIGAGSMSDGTYRYEVFLEWIDAAGNLHRSAASPPVEIELTGGTAFQSVDLTIPVYAAEVPHKLENMRFSIYRTLSTDPATYYRVGNVSAEADGTDRPVATFTDTLADATLQDNSQPYTTWEQAAAGGELEAGKPPHASIIASSRDRIMLVPDEDPKCVCISKPAQTGIAPEFSEYLTLRIEQGGDITGIAEIDGRIVIFKDSEIYVVSGEGTGPTGIGSWSLPERITTDIGCVEPRSVVRCDKGIMFRSRRGIYLLDRSFQPGYIGAPVEAWNDYEITCSVVFSRLNQVLFNATTGNDTVLLVYDYAMNKWSIYTGQVPVAMCVHGGELWYIDASGSVYAYDETTFRDGDPADADDVTMSVTLPWVSGYHRCWWVYAAGKYMSPHRLKIELSYDYDPTVVDTALVSFATTADEIARVMPSRQWSLAVRAKVSVVALDGDTALDEGASLDQVEYHVGIGPERSWPVSQARSK